jgi:DNA-directed RNA polymerase specialized sigma24 family protein
MPDFAQAQFDRLISEQYEAVKGEVLATVRAKLAAANLYADPLDLDAAYNAAWHALYEHSVKRGATIQNLGGWLATIAFRRAIDDVRSSQLRLHAVAANDVTNAASEGSYERDIDAELSSREKYHQWLMSVRLRLTAREQQAISLCVLHEHSRREASEIMGIDIKRLDKVMTAANKKLGGALEAISRGDWCQDQRSLIKAYAFGLHDEGGERHALAIQHIMQCQACAAYVRSVRGLAGIMPPSALLAGAVSAGGGILSGLAGLFKSGATGTAAAGSAGTAATGGGGATVLGGLGTKAAAVCATAACATGGTLIVVQNVPRPSKDRKPASASTRPATQRPAATPAASARPTTAATNRRSATSSPGGTSRAKVKPVDPNSKGAQEIAELGIEPQATQRTPPTTHVKSATPPPPPPPAATPSEFDFEGG